MWPYGFFSVKEKFTKSSHNGPTKNMSPKSSVGGTVHFPHLPHVPHLKSLTSHRSSTFIKSQHIISHKKIFRTSHKFKSCCNMLHYMLQLV